MEKKTLNLNFVELGHQQGNTDVCLMPCPCSSSYSYPSTTYQGTGGVPCGITGYIAGKAADALIGAAINKGKGCQAEQAAAAQAAECGYDIDYGGTTNLGPSCGCGGGASPK